MCKLVSVYDPRNNHFIITTLRTQIVFPQSVFLSPSTVQHGCRQSGKVLCVDSTVALSTPALIRCNVTFVSYSCSSGWFPIPHTPYTTWYVYKGAIQFHLVTFQGILWPGLWQGYDISRVARPLSVIFANRPRFCYINTFIVTYN